MASTRPFANSLPGCTGLGCCNAVAGLSSEYRTILCVKDLCVRVAFEPHFSGYFVGVQGTHPFSFPCILPSRPEGKSQPLLAYVATEVGLDFLATLLSLFSLACNITSGSVFPISSSSFAQKSASFNMRISRAHPGNALFFVASFALFLASATAQPSGCPVLNWGYCQRVVFLSQGRADWLLHPKLIDLRSMLSSQVSPATSSTCTME